MSLEPLLILPGWQETRLFHTENYVHALAEYSSVLPSELQDSSSGRMSYESLIDIFLTILLPMTSTATLRGHIARLLSSFSVYPLGRMTVAEYSLPKEEVLS